jgi:hypothetical protein
MFRRLWKLLDEIAPALTDAIVHNVSIVWDFLGFFGLPVALTLGLSVIGGALYLNDRYFRSSIAARHAHGQADFDGQPVLALTPTLKGAKRVFRPRHRPLLVHVDAERIRIEREKATTDMSWKHVIAWQRKKLTHWTLYTATNQLEIALSEDHGFTGEELRRIEDRLIYHVATLPQRTFIGEVRTSLTVWQTRVTGIIRRSARARS